MASLSTGLAALNLSGGGGGGAGPAAASAAGAGAASPLPPTPASPSSTQATLIVGTLNLSLRVRYGMTSRHVPLYLFTPYDPAHPSYRVACSTPEKENHVALIEPYANTGGGGGGGEDDVVAAPAAAAGAAGASVALPRGTLVRLLGPSGDSEAEAQALKWQAVPFPPYPDATKPQGAWLAAELDAASARLAVALAPGAPCARALLDWPATFNIDNATTRDIDDVVSVRRSASGGGWDFAVTIADVAACVPQGSLLDVRARELGQTLYSLEGVALRPMLPHALSERDCSLVAGALRAGVALHFHWDGTTTPRGTSIACSGAFAPVRLLNRHSFAYESVAAAGEAAGLGEELRALAAAAGELGRRLGIADRDMAADPHTWVEALMLFYNVAAGVRVQGARAGLLRKHGAATQARLEEYAAVDAALAQLAYHSAAYVPADDPAPRHWGLGAEAYAHASSPIRRYSDLYNQRVLVGSSGGGGGGGSSSESGGEGELCAWLNARSQSLKRYSRDAFFLSKIVASSLITVSAVFLRLCVEEEEGGAAGGGGGGGGGAVDNGESPDEDAAPAPAAAAPGAAAPAPAPAGGASKGRAGRAQRRAEFWVGDWKRILRLRLTIVAEAPAPAKAYTVLTKDESQTYELRPGTPVTLKAFANLRGKNWKKSMVFSCTPAS